MYRHYKPDSLLKVAWRLFISKSASVLFLFAKLDRRKTKSFRETVFLKWSNRDGSFNYLTVTGFLRQCNDLLSVDYTRELLKNGYAAYTDVLTSEQLFLSAQLSRIDDKLQQLTAGVNLYRSLGGGWK